MSARLLVLALLALLGCARPSGRAGSDAVACMPVSEDSLQEAAASDISGTYRLTLVATSGDSAGRHASGSLVLGATARSDAALVGRTNVSVEQVGAYKIGDLDIAGDSAPGVLVFDRGERGAMLLRLGSQANVRGVMMFEGEHTVLIVQRADGDGFKGSWRSGAVAERAAGHFCAVRDGSRSG